MAEEPTTTLWLGNLDPRVTRRLLYELGIQQAGPVISISLPVAVDGSNRGYGFVEFESVESAAFAVRLFRGLTLFGRPVRTDFGGKKAGGPQQQHGGMAAAPVQY
ncbi:hypothetical protein CHLNCDRAFT_24873 [Chlorella variabilis]|uniref:RRM domain-containing protein n=1 Tax=Chlorella variabilis TaxID=554065 RepID=E1ZIU1_CHLVA|nr:hypothetical protein CHLNCDRAFT_24873 [Chlorella variabilis]EFN54217.1 hypothetical protein CHLNCDRAFT_24873 [Chlorella variabilis]|eukprot:XP_005846319.1 hypothetical protein CHLNCDRAFT_24873 [Chlorella variabilis]